MSEVGDLNKDYKYGFSTDIDSETIKKGLTEETIRVISQKKEEPQWMLDSRLKAFEHWKTLEEPKWANLDYEKIKLPGHFLL